MHLVVALRQTTSIDLHANIFVDHGLEEVTNHFFMLGRIKMVHYTIGADHIWVRHTVIATRLRPVFEMAEVAINLHSILLYLVVRKPVYIAAALRVERAENEIEIVSSQNLVHRLQFGLIRIHLRLNTAEHFNAERFGLLSSISN